LTLQALLPYAEVVGLVDEVGAIRADVEADGHRAER
jgi:hypothetical protein